MTLKGYIFDYGGTLDTGGQHWARVIWKAWQHHAVPVGEQQFREAYVYAERTLGRNPIVLPSYTFKKLLDVKLRLQMEYLFMKGWWTVDKQEFTRIHLSVLEYLYGIVLQQVAHSREVLLTLRERCPLVLVSNFYGNIETVLHEMKLSGIFSHVIESAVVGVRKPDARIFQLAVDAFARSVKPSPAPEELMVVGDSLTNDIIPASSIGCQAAWLSGEGWQLVEDSQIPTGTLVITDLRQLSDS